MNIQNLIIYDFAELFYILDEIKNNLNFKLSKVSKKEFANIKLDYSINNLNTQLLIVQKMTLCSR